MSLTSDERFKLCEKAVYLQRQLNMAKCVKDRIDSGENVSEQEKRCCISLLERAGIITAEINSIKEFLNKK